MSRVERQQLERASSLDLQLSQDWAFRETCRYGRLRNRLTGIYSTASGEGEDARGVCVGGLQISFVSGSTVQVAPGALLGPNPSPITEARPGSWTGPASPEPDDDIWCMAVLPAAKSILPGTPISGSTSGDEWWRVYVTVTNLGLEQDSNRKVFDQNSSSPTYGQFIAASSFFKTTQLQATPHLLRGTASAGLPALPAGAIEIGRVFVPVGSTDLSNAYFLDSRRFIEPGPNTVDGVWQNPTVGSNTNTALNIWIGDVTARIGGEVVRVSTRQGFSIVDVAEPGATWTSVDANTTFLAWIYLAKPGGYVTRPRFKGGSIVHDEPAYSDGVLIISPTAPALRVSASGSPQGQHWDLRPSSALRMPENQVMRWGRNFAASTVQPADAICIGVMTYALLNGGTYPQLDGPIYCDGGGWIRGLNFVRPSTSTYNATVTVTGSELTSLITLTIGTLGAGGSTLPFDALRVEASGTAGGSLITDWCGINFDDGVRAFRMMPSSYLPPRRYETWAPYPGGQPPAVGKVAALTAGAISFLWTTAFVSAARFPYARPLAT